METNKPSRRTFVKQTALVSAVVVSPKSLFSPPKKVDKLSSTIKSKGYASRDKSGTLLPWEFERRPLGDSDILIDIKYSGICHSDIHQERAHWAPQQYPQVPGHEIAGIVSAVGKKVTKFKVGDKAGVGCMADSCLECESCKHGEEQYCERGKRLLTYGSPDSRSPSGITQGGYSTNLVVRDHFAIKIPANIDLQLAAPLLCAGITTYSPLMRANFKKGDKVGIAGIGGLGHIAIQLAASKGADVYAFTTSASKVDDIKRFGAKEVIVVDTLDKLKPYQGQLDYMISTIPYDFDIASYANVLKPYKEFTQIGLPIKGELTVNNSIMIRNRVNLNGSLIGGIPETQEVMDYCAKNKIYPQIQLINAGEINEAWNKVVDKQARYRFVIDATTLGT